MPSEQASGTLEMGATTRLRYIFEAERNLTFRLCVSNGRIIVYASSIPNPNSAQYEEQDEVNHMPSLQITCLTKIYYRVDDGESNSFEGQTNEAENNDFLKRKRRQVTSELETSIIYITLEGQDDINEFNFNSSEGSVTFGKYYTSSKLTAKKRVS